MGCFSLGITTGLADIALVTVTKRRVHTNYSQADRRNKTGQISTSRGEGIVLTCRFIIITSI